jgi:hypothetical protein
VAENPSVGDQDDVVEVGESVGEIISSGSQKVVAEKRTTFVVGEGVKEFWKRRKCERWSYRRTQGGRKSDEPSV